MSNIFNAKRYFDHERDLNTQMQFRMRNIAIVTYGLMLFACGTSESGNVHQPGSASSSRSDIVSAGVMESNAIANSIFTDISSGGLPGRYGLIEGRSQQLEPLANIVYDLVPYYASGLNESTFIVALFRHGRSKWVGLKEIVLYGDFLTLHNWRGTQIATNAFSIRHERLGGAIRPIDGVEKTNTWVSVQSGSSFTVCGEAPVMSVSGSAAYSSTDTISLSYSWNGKSYSLVDINNSVSANPANSSYSCAR